ncbi:hypothetical protein C8R43DRAFT_1143733 [Mycena crocata]|nr:hypothetical protein C8R43DRAFT_1143733 [Mycena crocata]
MYSVLIAQSIQSRLLRQLQTLPIPLLSCGSIGHNFHFQADFSGQDSFLTEDGDYFQPVAMGQVRKLKYDHLGSCDAFLGIPIYSLPETRTFFYGQLRCLAGEAVRTHSDMLNDAKFEKDNTWAAEPGPSCNFYLQIPYNIVVKRTTPGSALDSLRGASVLAAGSSSPTLGGGLRPRICVGDLLVVKCNLSGPPPPHPYNMMYGLTALHVEIVI